MHPEARAMVEDVIEEGGANPTLFANCVAFAIEIWEASSKPEAPQVVAALQACTDVNAARALLAEGE